MGGKNKTTHVKRRVLVRVFLLSEKVCLFEKKKNNLQFAAPTQDNTHAPEKIDATGTKNKTSLFFIIIIFRLTPTITITNSWLSPCVAL